MHKKLTIFGEFDPSKETHILTETAIEHSLEELGRDLKTDWVPTNENSDRILSQTDEFRIAPPR